MVDHVRGCWDSVGQPDMADHPLTIVGSLYEYLVHDQEFIDVVVQKREHLVTSRADWNEIAKAYAWLILQKYNRELGEEGDA